MRILRALPENVTFTEYSRLAATVRGDLLHSMAEVAHHLHFIEVADMSKFILTLPGDHNRLMKEVDTVRIFAHAIADGALNFVFYPSSAALQQAQKEMINNQVGTCFALANEVRTLELELGLCPIQPGHVNTQESHPIWCLLEERKLAASNTIFKIRAIAREEEDFRNFKLKSELLRYYTGPDPEEFGVTGSVEEMAAEKGQKRFDETIRIVWNECINEQSLDAVDPNSDPQGDVKNNAAQGREGKPMWGGGKALPPY
jgi:hypothetical protein